MVEKRNWWNCVATYRLEECRNALESHISEVGAASEEIHFKLKNDLADLEDELKYRRDMNWKFEPEVIEEELR